MTPARVLGLLLASSVLLLAPHSVKAQCCGDCGGDGQVSIGDLVTAVNNALNGCAGGPTPSPTLPAGECPIDFGDDNTQPGTPDCYYRGRWNDSCGAADLEALWRSDHSDPELPLLIVTLLGFEPGLFLGAEVTADRSANLIGWYTEPDASDLEDANGQLTLSVDRSILEILPQPSPFNVDGCPFRRYQGHLFAVDTPSAARAGAAAALRNPKAMARLRAAAAARQTGPDFKRR